MGLMMKAWLKSSTVVSGLIVGLAPTLQSMLHSDSAHMSKYGISLVQNQTLNFTSSLYGSSRWSQDGPSHIFLHTNDRGHAHSQPLPPAVETDIWSLCVALRLFFSCGACSGAADVSRCC